MLDPFPVDELTLAALEHAMGGAYDVDEDGTHRLVGSEFSLGQLLDFLSGYDKAELIEISSDVFEYPGHIYHYTDVIRALIAEVRRLRD